jgi:PST family polysaccharide transporter
VATYVVATLRSSHRSPSIDQSIQLVLEAGEYLVVGESPHGLGLPFQVDVGGTTPEAEVGIVGFAVVAITYLSVAQDLGLAGALIYHQERPERAAHVVFSWNVVLGVVLFIVGLLTAPLAARFFGDAEVTSLMRALSLTFLIAPLGAVHMTLLHKELDLRRKMFPDVGSALVKGVASIVLALAGFGVWALVLGHLAGVLVGVVLAWVVVKWRPRFAFDRDLTRTLMTFGLPLFLVDVIYVVTGNVDYLIVGRVLGAAALGIYTLAYRIPELLVLGVVSVLSRTMFPAFTKAKDSMDSLRRGFAGSVRYVVIFTTPICVGLFVVAEPLVLVMLGPDWLEVVPVLRVLAAFAWVRSLMSNDGDVYKALGQPGFLARITGLRLAILVPALLVATPYGLVAVAVALLITTVLDKSLRIYLISRQLDMRVTEVIAQFVPAVVAAVPLSLVSVATLFALDSTGPLTQLLVTTLAGAVTYLGAIWLLEREALRRLALLVRTPRLDQGPV